MCARAAEFTAKAASEAAAVIYQNAVLATANAYERRKVAWSTYVKLVGDVLYQVPPTNSSFVRPIDTVSPTNSLGFDTAQQFSAAGQSSSGAITQPYPKDKDKSPATESARNNPGMPPSDNKGKGKERATSAFVDDAEPQDEGGDGESEQYDEQSGMMDTS